jgi:hypothetical protein
VCIAQGIPHYFPFLDSDDRLEGFFGMQRVLEAGRNFDAIQFEERAGELMRLEKIYERNPEWKLCSRRLAVKGRVSDHCSAKDVVRGANGCKNHAPVDVSTVVLSTCWWRGAAEAASALSGVVNAQHYDYEALAQ